MAAQPVKDHNGIEYESFSAMCTAHNLPNNTVRNRLDRGWSLKDALTISNKPSGRKLIHDKEWSDHLGNKYNSVREMCDNYGISEKVFWSRKRLLKWPLEKILTTPVSNIPSTAIEITDHLGNKFKSISDLCRYHNIGLSTFRERRKLGWSVEKALTTPTKKVNMTKQKCTDHLGNEYESLNQMCRAYNIDRSAYTSRLKLGWSQKDALTKPNIIYCKSCVDYNGQEFPTLKDMANYYNLPVYALQGKNRGNNDKDMTNTLIKKLKNRFKNLQIQDMLVVECIKFPYFMVSKKNYECILHIDHILNAYHNSDEFDPLPDTKIQNKPIEIIRCIKFPYYLINMKGYEVIWSYWEIIKYNMESNFGLKIQED